MKKSLYLFLATTILATTCAVASVVPQKHTDRQTSAASCCCNPLLGCMVE